ncbi:MAG: transposase [Parachlamydiaceae bacterium]|nr:MAG: transposase [Parachlamydiaceae bacterium]
MLAPFESWREDYNECRPHRSLKEMSPADPKRKRFQDRSMTSPFPVFLFSIDSKH